MKNYKITCLIGAMLGLYLLSLTGENEPDWLPYAITLMLIAAVVLAGVGIADTAERGMRQPAIYQHQHDGDEHRDNAI